jgi:hypothetical protein
MNKLKNSKIIIAALIGIAVLIGAGFLVTAGQKSGETSAKNGGQSQAVSLPAEKSTIEIKPVEEIKPVKEVPEEIKKTVNTKSDTSTSTSNITYALNPNGERDQRALIDGGKKQLPFENIQGLSKLDGDTVIVTSYIPEFVSRTGNKIEDIGFTLRTKPNNPSQGIYIYNYKNEKSIKVFGGDQFGNWFEFVKLPEKAGKLIAINTGQTIEIIDYNGNRIRTAFANQENVGHEKSKITIKPDQDIDGKLKILLYDKNRDVFDKEISLY